MKNVIVLGSTGSLGIQMLRVLKKHKNKFKVVAITAKTSQKLLFKQGDELGLSSRGILLNNPTATRSLISSQNIDIVINLISGVEGIAPTRETIKAKKILILGNKESAVAGVLTKNANVIPVDSEHNAIFEILKKFPEEKIKTITLPASGGQFHKAKSLKGITKEQAIKHPKWKMGPKISVESATLLNKGLEIIEAHYLFKVPIKNIKVVVHPECEIHGMVEFKNGETYGYFSPPNMEKHLENGLLHAVGEKRKIDIRQLFHSDLKFQKPNPMLLPGINLVLSAFKKNPKKMLTFLKKEEKVINDFLKGKIEFEDIYDSIK